MIEDIKDKTPPQVPPPKIVILMDDDRREETEVELSYTPGYLITISGTRYHHVDTAPDGRWKYVKG